MSSAVGTRRLLLTLASPFLDGFLASHSFHPFHLKYISFLSLSISSRVLASSGSTSASWSSSTSASSSTPASSGSTWVVLSTVQTSIRYCSRASPYQLLLSAGSSEVVKFAKGPLPFNLAR